MCDFCFFFFSLFFASNPLTEFCYIHLIFTSVGRHHEVCRKLLVTNCKIIVLFLSNLVQYCAVRSTLDLVQVDVVLISSGFIVSFQGVQESNLETTQASALSSPFVKYCKTSMLSVAVFISHYSTVIGNITFAPLV